MLVSTRRQAVCSPLHGNVDAIRLICFRLDFGAPWHEEHMFTKLEKELNGFDARLPDELKLNNQNTTAHCQSKSPTHYFLMHCCLLLSRMMIHREYLPFLPFTSSKPDGPMDRPIKEALPPGKANFWKDSARDCFRSTRDLLELISTYHEWGTLVETPLAGHAIYQVCQVCKRTSYPYFLPL